MITSNAFDNIDLLNAAADASAKRSTVLANNLANADTPYYKRKDIDFSKTLMSEIERLAAQNTKHTNTERFYYPRTYGLQYGVSYGTTENYMDVPTEDYYETESADVDMENVGNLAKLLDTNGLRPKIYTEYEGLSYRIDKNNVDPDTENVELASEQIKYQVLTQSIRSDFTQMKSVMGK